MARGVAATAFIIPGHGVVTFEHRYDLPFLRRLCIDSPWVPAGHEDLWARGLGHGLNGDFPSAVSVLVPQIEHALRQVLKAGGAYTLLVDDATGVESEKGLGSLLTMPEAKEVLGAELQYELSTLLIESQGDNLRHDTAHGLLHDGQAWSAGAVYAWWLCLRLVVVPLWNAMETRSLPSGPEAADEAPLRGRATRTRQATRPASSDIGLHGGPCRVAVSPMCCAGRWWLPRVTRRRRRLPRHTRAPRPAGGCS